MQLILASRSPRRKEIMEKFGLKFRVVPADIDETQRVCEPPHDLVKRLAVTKVRKVANQEHGIIIAADTIVVFQGEIIGKPGTLTKARAMLRKLSGDTHKVFTGYAIMTPDKLITDLELTHVTFKLLNKKRIDEYLGKVDVLDKAGAYAVQEEKDLIISKIAGDYYNVMGLPQKAVNRIKDILNNI